MQNDHFAILQKVCKNVCSFYVFDIYTKEDIYQEAIIAGLSIYKKWDGVRPLDKFLSHSIQNILRNLIMTKLGTEGVRERKISVLQTSDIMMLSDSEVPMYTDIDRMDEKLIFEKLDKEIKQEYRKDYLKLKLGHYVSKQRRDVIVEELKRIMGVDCDTDDSTKLFIKDILNGL